MSRIASLAMLASACSLMVFQLAFVLRSQPPHGIVNACPSEDAAVLAPHTISEIIARFEEWRGSTCTPRIEKPFLFG